MNLKTRFLLLAASLLLACGTSAVAAEYADINGFSFTHPEDWTPLNGQVIADPASRQAFPPELQQIIDGGQLDLSKIAVALFRTGPEDFLENMNVVTEKNQIPVNDKAVKELTTAIKQQATTVGMQMSNLNGTIVKVANRDAIMLNYDTKIPGVPTPMKQRQYYLPGGGKTYIITCTATADSFAKYQPVFEQIVGSFQAPAPVATGINWSQSLSTGVLGGIIGGVVGIIMWIKNKFGKK